MKNEEKMPSDANKKGRGLGSGNTVWREAFADMSETIKAMQVKFDCGEGNGGDGFWNAYEGRPHT